jgi:hypothetical protein
VEELQRYVAGAAWEKKLLVVANESCARTFAQWRAYRKAYDSGLVGVKP